MFLVIQNSTRELLTLPLLTLLQNFSNSMKDLKQECREFFNFWERWLLMETPSLTQHKNQLDMLEESNQRCQFPQRLTLLNHHQLDGDTFFLKEDQRDLPKLLELMISHLLWIPLGEMLIRVYWLQELELMTLQQSLSKQRNAFQMLTPLKCGEEPLLM